MKGNYTQSYPYEIENTFDSNFCSFNYVNVSSTFITQGTVFMYTASLPTTNPGVVNQLWRSGSYLMISTGSGS